MATLPALDPEFAVAAACTILEGEELREAVTRLIARPDFDWDRLGTFAFHHEIEQVVRSQLEMIAPGAIPAELAGRMQLSLVQTTALQLSQASVSARLANAFAEAGVPMLFIKGLGLAQLLYGPHPELRSSNDVDIVIAPEDLSRADLVLKQAGLTRTGPEVDPPEKARAMFERLVNVYNYNGAVFGELVELHIRPTINPHWMPSFAEIHAACSEIEIGGTSARVLDGPLNTYYLCQHALYNLVDYRLKWFGDIRRAVRRAGMQTCTEDISRYHRSLPIGPGKHADLVLDALKAGIAATALPTPPVVIVDGDVAAVVRELATAEGVPVGRRLSHVPWEVRHHAKVMRHLPGWRGKAHQALYALSDPRDVLTLQLGQRFAFVYWLAGPVLSFMRFIGRTAAAEDGIATQEARQR